MSRHAPLHRSPWWLPGGHAQTIWSALAARRDHGTPPRWRRERWPTPDGDFVDADWLDDERAGPDCGGASEMASPKADGVAASPAAVADSTGHASRAAGERPLLVAFHGLEGSSRSHYAQAFGVVARAQGWACVVPHFRGCSGELNLAPRAYHSGDHAEIGWMLAQARARHAGPAMAVGVSLGGNALLRWAEEAGESATAVVKAVAAVSSPVDLEAGGRALERGFSRLSYTPMFLRTMKTKALAKLAQHPGLFDRERLMAARTLHDFDDVFTAPLHGYRDALDYWRRASAKPHLARIRVPALVLNARNDPFVPATSLPAPHEVGPCVTLWQPPHGGHVGFARGRWPGHVVAMPEAVAAWLARHL